MTIDPKTTIGQLVAALPSTLSILRSYGIAPVQAGNQPIGQALVEAHVNFEEFLQAVERIDWQAELPPKG